MNYEFESVKIFIAARHYTIYLYIYISAKPLYIHSYTYIYIYIVELRFVRYGLYYFLFILFISYFYFYCVSMANSASSTLKHTEMTLKSLLAMVLAAMFPQRIFATQLCRHTDDRHTDKCYMKKSLTCIVKLTGIRAIFGVFRKQICSMLRVKISSNRHTYIHPNTQQEFQFGVQKYLRTYECYFILLVHTIIQLSLIRPVGQYFVI